MSTHSVQPMLADLHTRLAGVNIECPGYSDFIARDDGSGTFFDLDPPCRGCEDAMVIGEDFARPAQQRRGLNGRFLRSIGDVPEVREVCAGFAFEEVRTAYTIPAGGAAERASLWWLPVRCSF